MANEPQPQKNGIQFPHVEVKGKLINVLTHETRNGNVYEHVINLPSADSYDYPPGIAVKSKTRLGNKDEIISIIANCVRRGYKDKNGNQRYNHEFWLVDGE